MTPETRVKKTLKKEYEKADDCTLVSLSDRFTVGIPDFILIRKNKVPAFMECKAAVGVLGLTLKQALFGVRVVSLGQEYYVVTPGENNKCTKKIPMTLKCLQAIVHQRKESMKII